MFYDNLKTICEKQNLKITNIVIECGGAPGSINGWKKGSMPNSNIVVALAMRLNVSTDYLLLGKEHQSNTNNSFNNNNIAYGDNSKVQVNSDDSEKEIYIELSKIIKSLPLKERSKLITIIYDYEEQYHKYGSAQMPQAHDMPVNEQQFLKLFKQFNNYEQVKIIGKIEEWLDVKRRREQINKKKIVGIQIARRNDSTSSGKIPLTAEEAEKIAELPEETNF